MSLEIWNKSYLAGAANVPYPRVRENFLRKEHTFTKEEKERLIESAEKGLNDLKTFLS